jgi:colanic acid biosynthesis glycosyl transferase WcaI
MKLLISSPSFYPEHSGSAPYSTDLAVYFAEQGHEVTVVTAFPFYPSWRKRPKDRGKLFEAEEYEGVKVLRGYLYVPKDPTASKRILHELSFTIFAGLNFLKAGRHECVVVSAAPISLQLVGVIFKLLWKAQLVIHIQDLQSDAALSLGMVRLRFLLKLLSKFEAFLYRHASWVATISPAMKENLRQKGVRQEKLAIYPNWIDVAEVSRLNQKNLTGNFLSKYPVAQDKFTIAYAGNIGVKQSLEVLVDLAEASQGHEDVHYFIIGEGSRRSQVEKYAKDKALKNVTFVPFMPQKHYFEMLQDIDVLFVSQKAGSGNVFLPGKLLGIMAMSKPLLVSADLDSELAAVVSEAECGFVSAPSDLNSLLKNVISLKDPKLRRTLGKNGYRYVQSYDREQVLSKFLARISR